MPLSEADTSHKLVNPAIYARGWTEDHIKREETTGKVEQFGGKVRRRSRGRTDLTLRIVVTAEMQPVAVAFIEVKKDTLSPGEGLDQAKGYATAARFHVPFVFSTNGHMFVAFDRKTGITSPARPMAEFPTPIELRARYEAVMGFSLDSPAAAPLLRTYKGGEGSRRYYQDAAIRAILEKFAADTTAKRPPRALLSVATGAGKTFIAANLLRRIADAGQLKRALFVCDRDELRTQALAELSNVFGDAARAVFRDASGRNNAANASVHVATYQTLGVDKQEGDDDGEGGTITAEQAKESFLTEFYPKDHFSHIIVDECHRSAWGKWSKILTMNPNAVQIGLTATPRQLKPLEDTAATREDKKISADNVRYFGEPVYEYEIGQAMEDGYLAAMDIKLAAVDLDTRGVTAAEIVLRNPTDANTGQPLSPQQIADRYDANNFERDILLPDRIKAMCRDLFEQMLGNTIHRGPDGATLGPRQKTIIFCATDRHAELVKDEMNNLFAAYTAAKGEERFDPYAFKCTAKAGDAETTIKDFRGAARSYFIATTVELLTTGVDVRPVRNVVFFKYVASPIAFYQMIGRGTRIDEHTGKLAFTVYDYTGATRLFGSDFTTDPPGGGGGGGGGGDDDDDDDGPPPDPTIWVEGFQPIVNDLGRFVGTMVDGRLGMVTLEDFKRGMSAALKKEAPTLPEFRARWVDPPTRRELLNALVSAGYPPQVVRTLDDMNDYDLFDVIAGVGYGLDPKTKEDRALAFRYKQNDWLNRLPEKTRAAVLAVADQFKHGGTEDLENVHIFQTPDVRAAGGAAALGLAGDAAAVIRETKERIFAA